MFFSKNATPSGLGAVCASSAAGSRKLRTRSITLQLLQCSADPRSAAPAHGRRFSSCEEHPKRRPRAGAAGLGPALPAAPKLPFLRATCCRSMGFQYLAYSGGGSVSPGTLRKCGRLPRVEKIAMKTTILLFASVVAVFAQVVPERYVLELSQDPAAVAATQAGARFAAQEAAFAARRAGVRQTQMSARAAVAAHGGRVVESMDTVLNALIVEIPDARASELMQIPGALELHRVHRVRPFLSHALPIHKVPDAWNLQPLGQNSAGAGIKIGMN